MSIAYPFGKKRGEERPFAAILSNELFFTHREPYFERNRFALNFTYKYNNLLSFMSGYLYQFDYRINDETGTHFFQLGFYFTFWSKQLRDNTKNNLQEK